MLSIITKKTVSMGDLLQTDTMCGPGTRQSRILQGLGVLQDIDSEVWMPAGFYWVRLLNHLIHHAGRGILIRKAACQ